MSGRSKLELTWIRKEYRPRLEPRILVEEKDLSYVAARRHRKNDLFDNVLIRGDNLLALKAIEVLYTDKVRCIFIDPPYNTGSAFEQFDDGLEHSFWLSLMRDRLEVMKSLLTEDGSIWITIDDHEAHYLKVLCDEIFGRWNFVASFVWQKTLTRRNDARHVSVAHDYVLVYAKNKEKFRLARIPADARQRATYSNRDNDPRGDWLAVPFHAPNVRANLTYPITTPSGRVLMPPAGRHWSTTREKFKELVDDNRIYFGLDGNGMAQRKKFWEEEELTVVPWTWWPYDETGENREANKEAKALTELADLPSVFATPKPERLLQRILSLATNPGDIVLDSFAGSGTTGAVAHKMGRRWIMVELGDHCETHIVPRLNKVIDGDDPGGVTKAMSWNGGGGYRYCKLAPSLLEKDQFGNWVISKAYNAEMLAKAMCAHFGFRYDPSPDHYWIHGVSSETDIIYVTTNSLTHDQLSVISEEVGHKRTLLICCKAFQSANVDGFVNLTIRKIPGAVLNRCEWGKNDYSLRVASLLPAIENELEVEAASEVTDKADLAQASLFEGKC